MPVHFTAQHPVFGRGKKPLGVAYQQRSPYYWWWAFLRRNERYLACCERDGAGELSELYAAFKDVRNDNFKGWWTRKIDIHKLSLGAALFGEQQIALTLKELEHSGDWREEWRQDSVLVIAASLSISKKRLKALFNKLLKKRHARRRGRKTFAELTRESTARFKLYQVADAHALGIQLRVYDACVANVKAGSPKTLADIGVELRLIPSARPKAGDDKREIARKRIVMAAAVSRYYRQARKIVENTSLGLFPKPT
jgi:hypothetical protein